MKMRESRDRQVSRRRLDDMRNDMVYARGSDLSFPSVTDTSSSDISERHENGWNNLLQCSGEPPHQFANKLIRSVQWAVGLSHNEKIKEQKREVKGWKHIFYRDVKPLRLEKYNEGKIVPKINFNSNEYDSEDEAESKVQKKSNNCDPMFPKTVPITEKYNLKEKIGFGGFSTVVRALSYKDGKFYAVKCIDVTSLSQKDSEHLSIEMSIMKTLRHKNIMSLKDAFFNDSNNLFLVMPYIQGGDLFERLQKKGAYCESGAKEVFRSIIEAVKYCHDNSVIHRDIKPENVMLLVSNKFNKISLLSFEL
mmetsp:Transcript_11047/g.24366  ORF Transcript_11047/g.24366 Transcript_11047/m.24366 type:complete len:307 (-) Transcript_11047:541-1461(-)